MKKTKREIFMDEHKVEIKEELTNNSIVLSFAVAIIIVGIFSIFYDSGNGLLIGIALSTLLLTFIQCFSNGNTMLNIFPIFTMLVFTTMHGHADTIIFPIMVQWFKVV